VYPPCAYLHSDEVSLFVALASVFPLVDEAEPNSIGHEARDALAQYFSSPTLLCQTWRLRCAHSGIGDSVALADAWERKILQAEEIGSAVQ
jgi:hypothetical protein